MFKVMLAMLITLAVLAGCNVPDRTEQETSAAYDRWYLTRAKVLMNLAKEQYQAGDLDKSRSSVQEALALAPDLVEGQVLLARIEIDKGRYDVAREHLARAEAVTTSPAPVAFLIGLSYERQNQYAKALQAYEKARALSPDNADYVIAAAEVLVSLGAPDEALDLLSSKMSRMGESIAIYSIAGRIAMRANRPDVAVDYLSHASLLASEDDGIAESLATAYFQAGRYDRAALSLQDLLTRDGYSQRAWVYAMLGESHLATGKARAAREAYETACTLDEQTANHWVGLAKASLSVNDPARAVLAARRALDVQFDSADASLILGFALLAQERPDEARDVLTQATNRHRDSAMLVCLLGQSYDALGEHDRARDCYRRTLELEPDLAVARQLLAQQTR